jgi:hypothetical protein
MDRLLESDRVFIDSDITVEGSKLPSIKRFYHNTNEYNQRKITDLINNSMNNIDKVYRIILEYEKIKNKDI